MLDRTYQCHIDAFKHAPQFQGTVCTVQAHRATAAAQKLGRAVANEYVLDNPDQLAFYCADDGMHVVVDITVHEGDRYCGQYRCRYHLKVVHDERRIERIDNKPKEP